MPYLTWMTPSTYLHQRAFLYFLATYYERFKHKQDKKRTLSCSDSIPHGILMLHHCLRCKNRKESQNTATERKHIIPT
ncbi:hypothetical protein BDV35DRAFT_324137 [Aspergillus flavus]|uniref:Uncharacterized protein n=1 Tax=Aspergillus flavus TaxID=5059 RepID=A0A5N6GM50_ASPFL|nr:hypothetical protein BDV35DRAFT_324137 [Aspergillus flavus]